MHLCAAQGARVRVSTSDLSVADAKLFATVACNVHLTIFDCAFCAGLAIGALVFLPCRCFCRAWILAALRYPLLSKKKSAVPSVAIPTVFKIMKTQLLSEKCILKKMKLLGSAAWAVALQSGSAVLRRRPSHLWL